MILKALSGYGRRSRLHVKSGTLPVNTLEIFDKQLAPREQDKHRAFEKHVRARDFAMMRIRFHVRDFGHFYDGTLVYTQSKNLRLKSCSRIGGEEA